MHTIDRAEDKTWRVLRSMTVKDEHGNSITEFQIMFHKMSFGGALRLCNMLNGGYGSLVGVDGITLKSWESCSG